MQENLIKTFFGQVLFKGAIHKYFGGVMNRVYIFIENRYILLNQDVKSIGPSQKDVA